AVTPRDVRTRAVDEIRAPQRDVSRLELESHRRCRVDADRLELGDVVSTAEHGAAGVERELAQAMATGKDHHAAVVDGVPVDGDHRLHVRARQVAIGGTWAPKATILMKGMAVGNAGRLPAHLIDDLLEIVSEKRANDFEQTRLDPPTLADRAHARCPLHEA